MTRDEVEALVAAADPWLALVIRFLASTECRISEALSLRPCDIKRVRDIFHVTVKGKGSKYRTVYITAPLYKDITSHFQGKAYLFEHAGHGYERRYVTAKIGALAKKVLGRTGISAHWLRHSFATMYYTAQKDELPELSAYLGHASTAITTQYYVHTAMSEVKATTVVSF